MQQVDRHDQSPQPGDQRAQSLERSTDTLHSPMVICEGAVNDFDSRVHRRPESKRDSLRFVPWLGLPHRGRRSRRTLVQPTETVLSSLNLLRCISILGLGVSHNKSLQATGRS